jgi:transcriptional regulator with XRE-family HTH domain
MTIKSVAEKMGISCERYRYYEKRGGNKHLVFIATLCASLGISPNDLLNYAEWAPAEPNWTMDDFLDGKVAVYLYHPDHERVVKLRRALKALQKTKRLSAPYEGYIYVKNGKWERSPTPKGLESCLLHELLEE